VKTLFEILLATALLLPVLTVNAATEQSLLPVQGTPEGEALYQTSCASCHGTDLRGTSKGPSHLSVIYEPGHHGDDAFRSAIANGSPQHHWPFGDMPPVEGLSSTEVDAIIAYVRDVQQREGLE
jgi:mono/diheme cytochrome c family protein